MKLTVWIFAAFGALVAALVVELARLFRAIDRGDLWSSP